MAKPSSFELELIRKITMAESKLEAIRKEHHDTCPVNDPHMPAKCTCGADELNAMIDSVLLDLKIQ